MKTTVFVLVINFTFLSLWSNAQSAIKNMQPIINKGYYSIGRNAEKLKTGIEVKVMESSVQPVVKKGYYAIESNNKKLSRLYSVDRAGDSPTPIRKGYYNIGNNSEKLK
jgi:hypothetical protein